MALNQPLRNVSTMDIRKTTRNFLSLFVPGMVGVVALIPSALPVIQELLSKDPNAPQLPLAALTLLTLANPTLLLAFGVALGLALSRRMGFPSHLNGTAKGPIASELPLSLGLGAMTGVLLIGLDHLFSPLLDPDAASRIALVSNRSWSVTLSGLFYGGITEELISRWGLMSLLAWVIWLLLGRNESRKPLAVWIAIIMSADLFAALHLPIVAAMTPLTPMVLARTMVLNSLAGIVYGWLYWRRSLESAMIAHATTHLAMTAASWLIRLL